MKKILISTFLFFGAAVLIFMMAGRDIPPPDTTDLIPTRTELPPEQNAYTYFVSATNALFIPKDSPIVTDYLTGKHVDDSMVEEIVSRNKIMVDIVAKGLDCQKCLAPEVTRFDSPIPYLTPWLKMGQVMALTIRKERLSGNHEEATHTCISILRFGNMIQSDAGCIINYLVGVSILEIGLAQARDIACDKGTPPEELARLSQALTTIGPFGQGLIRGMKVEYKVFAETINQFRDGKYDLNDMASFSGLNNTHYPRTKKIPAFFFQPNRTKLIYADFTRNVIKNALLCFGDMTPFKVENSRQLSSKITLLTRPNGVGRMLLALCIPTLEVIPEKKCKTECTIAATRLIVACNAYQRKEGKLPDSLHSLIPEYLAAIPFDPYDGKPFRYSQTKGIAYSVGNDLKDSGGSTILSGSFSHLSPLQQRFMAEDIVFEITPKAKQPPDK